MGLKGWISYQEFYVVLGSLPMESISYFEDTLLTVW